jgi:hypothetical protein
MSTINPPIVQTDPSKPHHVLNWRVPIELGGKQHAIVGTLDYSPVKKGGGSMVAVFLAVGLTLVAIAGAFVAVRILRRRPR